VTQGTEARKSGGVGSTSGLRAASINNANVNVKSAVSLERLFYPDQEASGCRGDGKDSDVEEKFLFADLEACCAAYFAEDMDACREIGVGGLDEHKQEEEVVVVRKKKMIYPGTQTERALGKSSKATGYYHSHPNNGPHTHGKSGKGHKSGKAVYYPNPKPLPVKPRASGVEVNMGGSLIANNLVAPPSGSADMLSWADSFEKTILRVLEEGFECSVYSIGGVAVGGRRNLVQSDERQLVTRQLQTSSDVIFNLSVVRPCPGCDDMGALIMGAEVFDDAYGTLDEKAKDGELSVIFCIFAEAAGLVTEPCTVTITSVEGTSLDVSFTKESVPLPPSTPRPTSLIAPTPTPPPVGGWLPETPPPTMASVPITPPPVTSTLPPVSTTNPPVVPSMPPVSGTPAPSVGGNGTITPAPSVGGNGTITSAPSVAGNETSPTYMPSYIPTNAPVSGNETTTTAAPSAAVNGTTSSPTVGNVTTTASPSVGNLTSTLAPSVAPINGTASPTVMPPPSSSSAGPTSIPAGAIYYEGFEQGNFPSGMWTTEGDAMWELSTEQVKSGAYSIKSGSLVSDDITPKNSNVTLTTGVDWPDGSLVLSVLAGVQLPIDDFLYFVDGEFRGQLTGKSAYELVTINLPPGEHTILFSYKFNPLSLDQLPPAAPGHMATVYIDDVYYLPPGLTVAPTGPPPSSSGMPTIANIPETSSMPTVSNVTTTTGTPTVTNATVSASPSVGTTASPTVVSVNVTTSPTVVSPPTSSSAGPTSIPVGSLYYDGFENAAFPDGQWTTEGDALWELSTEKTNSGVYSIKSGTLYGDDVTPTNSNVTFTTGVDWPDGSLHLSVHADTQLPLDDFLYFIDGEFRGQVIRNDAFEPVEITLPPGEHTIMFSYKFNPLALDALPPSTPEYGGRVFIDDVYFLPFGVTLPPVDSAVTSSPTSMAIVGPPLSAPPMVMTTLSPVADRGTRAPVAGLGTRAPVAELGTRAPVSGSETAPTESPTYMPSYIPTKAPVSGSVSITTPQPSTGSAELTLPPASAPMAASSTFFDGFENGDLTALDWVVSGVEAWTVDETKAYEGSYSAHIRTEDIATSGEFSQLDLDVTLDAAAFIQFYFNAPVAMPFESFELWVDDGFLTPLATPDSNWTQAGAILASGQHTVSWRYSKNPGMAPDDMLVNMPQPPYRVGEAWLDNVSLLPSTPSFTEDFETGGFGANNWNLSGDADWTVTDSNSFEGTYAATVSAEDIDGTTGSARLSIDIITEQGGDLAYQLLSPVEGPFELVNVFVDDVAVYTYSSVTNDWISSTLSIQPGKRQVTFELSKNPGGVPEDIIATIPKSEGYLGQVWLDNIVFTEN
jgi:hypothetical protein